jgi:hypothetical protein
MLAHQNSQSALNHFRNMNALGDRLSYEIGEDATLQMLGRSKPTCSTVAHGCSTFCGSKLPSKCC